MANTIAGANLAAIAEMSLQPLQSALLPLRAFTTDFSSDIAQRGASVTTRYATNPTAQDLSSGYSRTDTTLTAITTTLDTYYGFVWGFDDLERSKSSINLNDTFIQPAAYAIAKKVFADLWNLANDTNYPAATATELTVTAANFDRDDVAADLGHDQSRGRAGLVLGLQLAVLEPRRAEELHELPEGLAAEEIIRADHGERALDRVARTPHGMARAPGFLASGRRAHAAGQRLERLKDILHRRLARVTPADLLAEDRLKVAPDHENHPAESRPQCVEDRVVENRFARGTDRVDLLEPAIAGTHAGREDEEGRAHGKKAGAAAPDPNLKSEI